MKKIVLLFAISLIFISCSKEKNQIPNEYSFLIGKWVSAQTDGVYLLQIKPDYWKIKNNKFRDFKFKINYISQVSNINGTQALYCYQKTDNKIISMVRFEFKMVDNEFDYTKSEIFFQFSSYGDYGSNYFSKI